jgi:hypothetical protein
MKISQALSDIIRPDKRSATIFWFLTLGLMGLIFFLSSIEIPEMAKIPKYSDKFIHAFVYALLSLLLCISFFKSGIAANAFLFSVVIAAIYGVTDEYHQLFVPGRYGSIGDLIADFVGAAAGVIFLKFGIGSQDVGKLP